VNPLIPINPFNPLIPVNPYNPVIPINPINPYPPPIPLWKSQCVFTGGNPACGVTADDRYAEIPDINPATQPTEWLWAYLNKFKFDGEDAYTNSAYINFIPWNPVDVVGGDPQDNDMTLFMMLDGREGARDLTLYSALNGAVDSNDQAVMEYGPGWTYDSTESVCNYDNYPFNELLEPWDWKIDLFKEALTVFLGPQNPAYATTNGSVQVQYSYFNIMEKGMPTCTFTCAPAGLNRGSGMFYFDQIRAELGLPTSKENVLRKRFYY